MFNVLPTYLSLLIAFMLGYLIIKLYNFQRSLPDFQQVFDEFGEGLGKTFTEGLQNPTVKRAMGVLGKKSGEVRASDALKNKVATKVMGQNILLKKALEWLDISPTEGLELMGDPMLGPVVRNLMASFAKGGQGLLSGFNNPGAHAPTSRGNVPLMS